MKIAGLFLALGLILMPQLTFGQEEGGLVSCDGIDCNFCDVIETTDNVIDFLFEALSVVAVILLVVAGFRLVTSAGDVSAMTQARSMFTSVIIGLVIVLSAWLIVDTVMKALLVKDGEFASQFGQWNSLEVNGCGGLYDGFEPSRHDSSIRTRVGTGQTE